MDAITNYRGWRYEDEGACTNVVIAKEVNETGAVEPVTLLEVKAQSKIDTTAYDGVLTTYITVARKMIEDAMNISLVERVVTAYINNSLGGIQLPYGPVNGDVTSVTTEDGIAYDNPEFRGGKTRSLKYPLTDYAVVVYNAGYSPSTIPAHLKNAVLQQVDFLYRNMGSTENIGFAPLVKAIIYPNSRKSL